MRPELAKDLAARAGIDRWGVTVERFSDALRRSADKAFAGRDPGEAGRERYLRGLHLEDLALACACEDGHHAAWDHFVREFRPTLYRAAAAIDPSGGARDLADALYAELFGLKEKEGVRQSLLRYYSGRSSLGTWLRAVLSQRHVDRIRAGRRLEGLPEEVQVVGRSVPETSPDRPRHLAAVVGALTMVLDGVVARDRLRLACYYAQNLTLAQIGRMTGEHEATVSRHLTRTRQEVRRGVEALLEAQHGMGMDEIREALATVAGDPGDLSVTTMFGDGEAAHPRKDATVDRST